ncbi:hypothetical protein [Entomomonas asaccharolytica]|uniref:Uncharacterized protein n=1 Tax=Entomomonas asaccharolytica TaxID=2785331 RepID=A0A974RW64_9GAMM|nr:hypothetical protein [Entomomonas asaccharolytica]QQP84873.1 hypothetical protein JHT90_10740 [Entomomonas asaccharolytica]
MDIVRLTIASFIAATLLVGCGDKSSTKQTTSKTATEKTTPIATLLPSPKQGEQKEYWVQSYSIVTKGKTDWSNKNRVGTQILVNYQVKQVDQDTINLDVISNHTELQVRGLAAYPHPLLQNILANGMQYQLNTKADKPVTISQNDTDTEQQIQNSVDLKSEYHYLQFVMAAPFIPTAIPLEKAQQVTINNFMEMDKVNITVDEITKDEISLILQGDDQLNHLYGKAVIDKATGWIKKMALVKEAPVTARTEYKMRTILLMGPKEWSSNNKRQLITEMHIEESKQYLKPFPIFGFDKENWQKTQQQELAVTSTEGKLFNFNAPDGSTQLMLVYKNNIGSSANSIGTYQVTDLTLADEQSKDILATVNLEFNIPPKTKEINVATYKPVFHKPDVAPIKLDAIKTASAKVSFTPYQLETLVLPIDKDIRNVRSQDNDFSVDITPTGQANSYILHWQAKDNIIFGAGLINGAENSLVQYILPDTEAWLTPIESRIINSLSNGYENRIKIVFTNDIPVGLEIYLLKQADQAAYTNAVTFKRN